MSSDSDSNNDDYSSKLHGRRGVKSSSKPQSFETKLKTISMDRSLLMGERVESGQAEFDEHHQAKVSGATDILQASVSSNPNATVNFSVEQIPTQWSVHAEDAQASSSDAEEPKVEGTVTLTAAKLMEKLISSRIQARADIPVLAKLKDKVETKKDEAES